MSFRNAVVKYGPVVAAAGMFSCMAMAQESAMVTAASTALESAKTDATAVGGYVVGAIAVLVGIAIIIGLLRKA